MYLRINKLFLFFYIFTKILTADETFLVIEDNHHDNLVYEISVDNKDILTTGKDNTIKLYDNNLNLLNSYYAYTSNKRNKLQSIALDLNNNRFFSASDFYTNKDNNLSKILGTDKNYFINIFDLKTKKIIKTFGNHHGEIKSLILNQDKTILASTTLNKISFWDIKSKDIKLIDELFVSGSLGKVFIDNDTFVFTTKDSTIVKYNIQTKKTIVRNILSSRIMFLSKNSNNYILPDMTNGTIYILDNNFEHVSKIKTDDIILKLSSIDDTTYIGTEFGYLIKIKNGSIVSNEPLTDGPITAISKLDNKHIVISGGKVNKIIIYNIDTEKISVSKKRDFYVYNLFGVKNDKLGLSTGGIPQELTRFLRNRFKNDENVKIGIKNTYEQYGLKEREKVSDFFDFLFQIDKFKISDKPYFEYDDTKLLSDQIETNDYRLELTYNHNDFTDKKVYLLNKKSHKKVALDFHNKISDFYIPHVYGFIDEKFIYIAGVTYCAIYDIKGTLVGILEENKQVIKSIAYDNKKLYALSNDSIIKEYDLSKLFNMYENNTTSKTVIDNNWDTKNLYRISNSFQIIPSSISYFFPEENEYLIWTEDGYFTYSDQKYLQNLKWHQNQAVDKEAIRYDGFNLGDHFFRPDLVKLKLQGKEKEYQKAIAGMTYKEALSNPPPQIAIASYKTNSSNKENNISKDTFEYETIKTDDDKLTLNFNIKEKDNGGIGLIRIYQEGKLIKTIGKGTINKQSANLDTVIAQNEIDSKMKLAQKDVDKTYALGVSDINLTTSQTIKSHKLSTISNDEGIYSIDVELKSGNNEISIEAFNKTNTVTSFRENINIKADIPKRKPKLYAVVVGINDFSNNSSANNLRYSVNDSKAIKGVLLKSKEKLYEEVDITYLSNNDVSNKTILKAFEDIKSKAKLEDTVVFYISTHGLTVNGNFYLLTNSRDPRNWIEFNDIFKYNSSIKALNQVFIVDACQSGGANDIASSVYDSRASVLAKQSGIHLLSATTKGTYAFESDDPNIKHGVFTNSILNTFNDKNSDTNKDGVVSILEVSKQLKYSQTHSKQTPVIRNIGSDVELVGVE
ncbi:MAG: caspase family protein [Campylobacterota bacterium]|nr:caspase family protein [Campylobacterota bacterium]